MIFYCVFTKIFDNPSKIFMMENMSILYKINPDGDLSEIERAPFSDELKEILSSYGCCWWSF